MVSFPPPLLLSNGNIRTFGSIHWFPGERAELEVFLVENEVDSTRAGL